MNALRSPLAISIAALLGLGLPIGAQLPGPTQATLDVQDMQKAEQFMAQSNYAEALKLAQGIPKNYPTSGLIPGSNLLSGICYFYLKDYDKAIEAASKNLAPNAKGVLPEVLERSAIMIPNIYVAKAIEAPAGQEVVKKKSFEDAIKAYDEFTKRFPQSEEVESALTGKGRALAMTDKYEEAATVLKEALQKFPQSPTIQDTKYIYGLSKAQEGVKLLSNTGANAQVKASLDEAEKQFREIIAARQDLVLMNNSFMQVGDLLTMKAGFAPKESDEQKKLHEQALDFYRELRPKEVVIMAQEARVKYWRDQIELNRQKQDLVGIRRNQRILDKELEKLETVKASADQSVAARLRVAGIFLALGKYDEARVLLRFIHGYLGDGPETADDKKKIAYFITVTYAAQHVADKAVDGFEKFKATYKNDPIAENLPLLVGGIFIDPDLKLNDPDKAIKYFDEEISLYPTSKFAAQAVVSKGTALMQLKRFDEAIKALKEFIGNTKDKELLVEAEFNLALIYRDSAKIDDALNTFKGVRDNYPDTQQAEQAAFWLGQMNPDAKTKVKDLDTFISKFPNSGLLSSAIYFKANAQNEAGDAAGAIRTFRQLMEKYPDAEPTQGAYFETAKILRVQAEAEVKGNKKPDFSKVRDLLMTEFVVKYPNSDKVYASYAFCAELLGSEDKFQDGIKMYESYIEKHAASPDVAKAQLGIANFYKTLAEKVGPSYLSMRKEDQEKWAAFMNSAIKAAEDGIQKFPDSDEVSRLLELLLNINKTKLNIGLMKEDDVKTYFSQLAGKFEGKSTKQKIMFALANFLADRDKEKKGGWFDIMDANYKEDYVYSPSDIDRFGGELIRRKQLEKAKAVFAKLEADYPLPQSADPSKVTRTIGDAQSVALAGKASILQAEGKAAEGQALFERLKQLYPWSGKVAEAEFGIAAGLYDKKEYDEAVKLLKAIAAKPTAPVPLRAKAMMLLAKCAEALKDYEGAINNYIKIATLFESEHEIAAEGLWLGAQLQEKQAKGEIPRPKLGAAPASTPKPGASPKPGATPKPGAAGTKAATPTPKPGATPKPAKK